MIVGDHEDETNLKPEWANRPRVGDVIEADGFRGKVIATFYRNGEGGMHVAYPHGVSWTSCHRVSKIERPSPPSRESQEKKT